MISVTDLMALRRLGISNYHLFWRRQVQPAAVEGIAWEFMPQFAGDPVAMRDLRALLDESVLEFTNDNLTDAQVIVAVSRLLASGELLAVREGYMQGGCSPEPGTTNASDSPTPSPGPSSKQTQPENASLPPDNDAAAQAAALTNAASNGAPFCAH